MATSNFGGVYVVIRCGCWVPQDVWPVDMRLVSGPLHPRKVRCYALHLGQGDCGVQQYNSRLDPGLATKPCAGLPESACGTARVQQAHRLYWKMLPLWTERLVRESHICLHLSSRLRMYGADLHSPWSVYGEVPRTPRDSFTSCSEALFYERAIYRVFHDFRA